MKWLALLLAAGCAGATGEIVRDSVELGDFPEGASAPRIEAVLELGGGDVVLTAPVKAAPGDGLATVGEALWVRGSNFGRQPTVTIGGRPAAVLARTVEGGLVTRVPVGAATGEQSLTVSTAGGQGARQLAVRRLVAALPPGGGRLAVLELTAEGPRAVAEFPAAGQEVRASADGRAAYVLDEVSNRLSVFELPGPAGPRPALAQELVPPRDRSPVIAFAVASAAPTLMVMRRDDLMLLDITAPLRPVRGQPRSLPVPVQKGKPVRAALSPDGKTAAVLLEEGNRLALLDLRGRSITLLGELALAPEARVPVVADVAFVRDGGTVWVALGDTARSLLLGPQPTELVAIRIGAAVGSDEATSPGRPPLAVMTVARRVSLPEARSPTRLNTGGAAPLPSGASIRVPPERAAVFLTAAESSGATMIFRVGAEDRASALAAAPGVAGAAHLAPDGRWLLVPVLVRDAGSGQAGAAQPMGRLELVVVPADDRPGQRRVLDLGAAALGASPAAGELSPRRLPSLACQP